MAEPASVSPKFVSDLYGGAIISHSPIVCPIVPGAQLILLGSIMCYNDPQNLLGQGQDHRLRIIASAEDIPFIFGILLETIDAGPAGATDPVNASVDRKGSFRVEQLEVGLGATVTVPQCSEKLRDLGIMLEGLAAFGS